MLRIVQHTPERLVLQDRQPAAQVAAWMFLIVSVGAVASFGLQALEAMGRTDSVEPARLFGVALFALLGLGFVALGLLAVANFAGGVTCTLDRAAGTITIERVDFLRRSAFSHAIYSVSHLDVQTNADVQAYGLFVVLRSGERVPLAAIPIIEQAHVEQLRRQVREFLRGDAG
jgi:hypothetical protein